MRIGAKTVLGQECTISAFQHVSVGRECILADRVMLIDFDHGVVDVEQPIRVQGIYKRDVRVGHNVWVGYGACFLRGVTVGDNAIVGTNSRRHARRARRTPSSAAFRRACCGCATSRARCAGSSRRAAPAPRRVRNTGGPTRNGALQMRLDGIHHITAITGDAPGNVDFYTRVLGLRLVKKTVNQDDPSIYHLFYADEQRRPGLGPDVLRVPGRAARARRATAMVHRVVWRVGVRGGARLLGGAARGAEGATSSASDGGAAVRRPGGPRRTSCASSRCPTRR